MVAPLQASFAHLISYRRDDKLLPNIIISDGSMRVTPTVKRVQRNNFIL